MANTDNDSKNTEPLELDFNADDDFDALSQAGKKGLLGRFNTRFNDALQSGRGQESNRNPVMETAQQPRATADDLAIRRARTVAPSKMFIPEGVIIEGSLSGGADTEIAGRVEGNITVEGRLHLAASALVSGNVRAISCSVEGLVEGKVECSEHVDLGKTGRLNADVMAGKRIQISGQVMGNVTTPGVLQLSSSSKVQGDVRARRLSIQEGAVLNGSCTMRAPGQRQEKKIEK